MNRQQQILGGAVAVTAGFRITEKDLGEIAVSKERDGRDIPKRVALKAELVTGTPVWQALTGAHRRTSTINFLGFFAATYALRAAMNCSLLPPASGCAAAIAALSSRISASGLIL